MKATFDSIAYTSKRMDSYRKDSSFYKEVSAISPADGRAIVTARYYGPGSTVYCVVWVHAEPHHGTGCGKAGGYGYHKESAALAAAMSDLGVTMSESISGRGDYAAREAVEALAKALTGRRKIFIHEAHA